MIREDIAKYIEKRDNALAGSVNPDNIMMSVGASGAIVSMLKMLVRGPETGIMIPIPQYPLYSACLAEMGATVVPYYLNEGTFFELIDFRIITNIRYNKKANYKFRTKLEHGSRRARTCVQ